MGIICSIPSETREDLAEERRKSNIAPMSRSIRESVRGNEKKELTDTSNTTNPINKEIIIKCSVEEMIKAFFKDYVIIWHDPNANNQENQQYITQLKKFCKVFTFTEWEKAKDYIKDSKAVCHVVTSGTNGELLVKEVFDSENVCNIYIFCENKEYHSSWARNYDKKVSCVETSLQGLLSQIQKNLLEWYKKASSLNFNLPAFAPIFNDSDKSEMNHLHRYLKTIPNFQNREQAKADFLTLSKAIYTDAQNIAEFEANYNEYHKDRTLRWYTLESFLYKVTNNCLRIATSDSIQYCRLALKDIEQAIKDQYQAKSKSFNGLLYRGAYLSEQEWSSLKENQDKEIEMHGFLSVSKVKDIALNFMKSDPSKKALITIIVPKGPNEEEQGFAEVQEYSMYPQEKEILFNVRSRFTVIETEDKYSEDLPCRHLVLLYGAQGFRKFLAEQNFTEKISTTGSEGVAEELSFVSIKTGLCYAQKSLDNDAGPFLCVRMKDLKTEMEIKGCLLANADHKETPFYGYQCKKCQEKKQRKYYVCRNCSQKWCENCSEEIESCLEAKHQVILETSPFSFWSEKMTTAEQNHLKFHNNLKTESNQTLQQAEMHYESHEYEKAMKYYSQYIEENEANLKEDPKFANCYSKMGLVYHSQGEYKKALEYFLKSLDIFKSAAGDNHPKIAGLYSNIGLAYFNQGEPKKALEYYLKALEIWKSGFEENEPQTASFYGNIGMAYESQKEHKTALEYYLKSLEIRRSVYGESHPDVANSYNSLGSIYEKLEDYSKALEYHLKALEILKEIHGETHPFVSISLHNLGNVKKSQGEYKKALEYYLKSLDIKKSLYEENHPHIAISLHTIGNVEKSQGEYKKALECYLNALKIYKALYGEDDHRDIATVYQDIGIVFQDQEDYEKALEYYLQAIAMKRAVYGEDHIEVAVCFDMIGQVYYKLKASQKALVCYTKAFNIFKSVHGESHPLVGACFQKIGLLYDDSEEYKTALYYYLKSLDIFKAEYIAKGKCYAELGTSCQRLGMAYYNLEAFDTALGFLQHALGIKKAVHGENHLEVAACYNNIGMIYYNQGEYDKAREAHLEALERFKSGHGENHVNVATSYDNIGMTHYNEGEYEEALEYLLKSLEIFKSVYGEIHPVITTCYNKIGPAYYKQGDYETAVEYHLKCLQLEKALYGENHPSVATSYANIGMAYCNQGEYENALENLSNALNIYKSVYGEDHPQTVGVQLEIMNIQKMLLE